MKTLITLPVVILMVLSCFPAANAQLLYHPESVVYDSLRDRYLVSNWYSGDMIQIDSYGVQDYFIIGQHCYAGLHIVDDVVYVAGRNQGVRGFDLETGQLVVHVAIPGSGVLNDITSDNSGNLYVTDVNDHRIYKIDIDTGNWSTFVSSGLSSPNGIYFDEPHNRLLLVSSRNFSSVQAISLDDSSVTTIAYTGISILDGLTMDDQGNVYFSSWNAHSVYKYDSTFTNPAQQVSVHSPEPADIYYNTHQGVIAVPVFYGNYIDFVDISSTSTDPDGYRSFVSRDTRIYPNPSNTETVIEYHLESASRVKIAIFDILGREIANLRDGNLPSGRHQTYWDSSDKPSGVYFYNIQIDNDIIIDKITLLR